MRTQLEDDAVARDLGEVHGVIVAGEQAALLRVCEHFRPNPAPVPRVAFEAAVRTNRGGQAINRNTGLQQQAHRQDPSQRTRDVVHLDKVGVLPLRAQSVKRGSFTGPSLRASSG